MIVIFLASLTFGQHHLFILQIFCWLAPIFPIHRYLRTMYLLPPLRSVVFRSLIGLASLLSPRERQGRVCYTTTNSERGGYWMLATQCLSDRANTVRRHNEPTDYIVIVSPQRKRPPQERLALSITPVNLEGFSWKCFADMGGCFNWCTITPGVILILISLDLALHYKL